MRLVCFCCGLSESKSYSDEGKQQATENRKHLEEKLKCHI